MGAINVRCPNCTQTLRVMDSSLGARVRCKSCQHTFLVETQLNPPAHDPATEPMDLPAEDNVFEQMTVGPAPRPVTPAPGWTGSPGVFEQQTIAPQPPPPAPPAPPRTGGTGVFEQTTVGPTSPPPFPAAPQAAAAGVFEQQTVAGAPAPPAAGGGSPTTIACPACGAAYTVPAERAGIPFPCRCGAQLSAAGGPPVPAGAGGWYYERNGAPAGPVAERDLRFMATNDMLGADDRVWTPGMPAWQTAAAVLPRFFPDAAAGPGWPLLRVMALILSTVAFASVALLAVVVAKGRPVAVAKADPPPPADPPPADPVPNAVPQVKDPEPDKDKGDKPSVVEVPLKKSTPIPNTPVPTPIPMPPVPMPIPMSPVPNIPLGKAPDPAPPPPVVVKKQPPPVVQKRPPSPFPPPETSWESPWKELTDWRARVAGVDVTQVPMVTSKNQKVLSPGRYFVVWVDVENTSKTDRQYKRWQPTTTGECTLWYKGGGTVLYATYPPDLSREWFTTYTQPFRAGGPPILESLVFARPDTSKVGPLTLTLDGSRVGSSGQVSLEIPQAVWTRW